MYHIQQEGLFSFQQLLELQPDTKYAVILEHLPLPNILQATNKKSLEGRPEELNTRAMIYALIIRKIEQIPTIKLLVRRLKESLEFRHWCRFTDADRIPSEASFSRLIGKLHQSSALTDARDELVRQAISEGFLTGETLALDSSHVEAIEQSPHLLRKIDEGNATEPTVTPQEQVLVEALDSSDTPPPVKPTRGKRGGIPLAEREEWNKAKEAYEASLPLFDQKIKNMLPVSYEELLAAVPKTPSTGTKGDPRRSGRIFHWYGYKAGALVDAPSQYIVSGLWCSASVHEQRLAIVLMKGLQQKFPHLSVKHILADKGFDGESVYVQAREIGSFALIPLIRHKNPPKGVNEDYAPVCMQGHAYKYDSHDAQSGTTKYTSPKECKTCPLQAAGCQKVHKIRITDNLRLHTVPARGSISYARLYKQRTSVERVFSYLKGSFGMDKLHLWGARSEVEFEFSTLAYNLCKFSLDKLNQDLRNRIVSSDVA